MEGDKRTAVPFFIGMKKLGEKLSEIVNAEASQYGLFLVNYTISPTGLYRFYMDSENVLSMKELTEFTRHISVIIDEGDFGEKAFTFEISSPGADSPLQDFRQLGKHVGRSFKIINKEGTELKGQLEKLEGETLHILNEVKEKGKKKINIEPVDIDWEQIEEIKIILSFK